MSAPPAVTVLLPTHNGMAYLPQAVSSLLAQTFDDFELLVVDDGSTDGTEMYLRGLRDRRLRVVRNASSEGVTRALNRGVSLSTGRYIARADADDVSLPQRLQRQVTFLEGHPQVGLLGSAADLIDAAGLSLGILCYPCSDAQIRWTSFFRTPFAHPSVMLRRAVLEAHGLNYDPAFRTTQDCDLWVRMLAWTRGANVRERQVRIRRHPGSVSVARREAQVADHEAIAWREVRRTCPDCPVSRETLADVRRLLLSGGHGVAELRGRHAELALAYLELFRHFAAGRGREGRGALRRLAGTEVIRMLASAPRERRLPAAFAGLVRMDPWVLPRCAAHWIGRRLASGARRQ